MKAPIAVGSIVICNIKSHGLVAGIIAGDHGETWLVEHGGIMGMVARPKKMVSQISSTSSNRLMVERLFKDRPIEGGRGHLFARAIDMALVDIISKSKKPSTFKEVLSKARAIGLPVNGAMMRAAIWRVIGKGHVEKNDGKLVLFQGHSYVLTWSKP